MARSERRGKAGDRGPVVPVLMVALATVLVLSAATFVLDAVADEPPLEAATAPRYADMTDAAGIDTVYDGDFRFFVGGGVAVLDCDANGRPDLYIAGGENPAGLYRNQPSASGEPGFLRLEDPATDLEQVTGAYPLDVDGDAVTDLMVLRHGENVLLRGLGDCRFERANGDLGLDGGDAWTVGFSATWEPGAELPTLAFGNYLDAADLDQDRGSCSDNTLLRPATGEATYADPLVLSPGRCALSLLFSDWDGSGRADLRVSNDRQYDPDATEQLWRIEDGQPPRLYTQQEGWEPLSLFGMGIASHDLTGDGYPEVFLTSQGDNKLQTLRDGADRPTYEDIAIRRGVTAHRPFTGEESLPSTAWHPEFADVNNDGLVDLFISKGNVEAQPDHATRDPNNLLLGQVDGTFDEGADEAGIVHHGRTRGAALVDLDLDGALDLVEVNRREPVRVWRNLGSQREQDAPARGWLQLKLVQDRPNRDAIGSWIEVRAGDRVIRREVTVGGGHASGQRGWIHFGLGTTDEVELRVTWSDGEVDGWMPVERDTFALIERGVPRPRYWSPDP
ncbi:MAG: CRTAC1 family protein [Nitriliruptoraceae bacterium]